MYSKKIFATVLCLLLLILSCVPEKCIKYKAGSNSQYSDNSGESVPSLDPMECKLEEANGIISWIKNLESEDMILTYTPYGKPSITATIEPGAKATEFRGASGNGRISIVRNQSFIAGRNDGADIEVCFVYKN